MRPQLLVNDFNNCIDRWNGQRLKLSLQNVDKNLTFIRVCERYPQGYQGSEVGTLIIRLFILHNDWSSGSRDSGVALNLSFLLSLSLCDRLTAAFKAGSLVTCKRLGIRFFRRIRNASRYRMPWVVKCATLGSKCYQNFHNGAVEVLNARLPSRCAIAHRAELYLPSEFRFWPSHCA